MQTPAPSPSVWEYIVTMYNTSEISQISTITVTFRLHYNKYLQQKFVWIVVFRTKYQLDSTPLV